MATRKTAPNTASQTKLIDREASDNGYTVKRPRAQSINFAKIQEILQRNVTKSVNKTFTRYTKDLIKTYLQSPAANQDTIREISRFLCRHSMLYQKLIMYPASMPLFHYNITPLADFTKKISERKALKDYGTVLEHFSRFNLKKDGYTVLYMTIRDGYYVGFMYDSDDGMFLMPLDVQYCRIYGKNSAGQWIVYFNADYFSNTANREFVEGIDGDTSGCWDQVFIDGWRDFQNDRRNAQWFRLPPEKTCVVLAGSEDEFAYPLPFWTPIFTSILDLLDLEDILQTKTEIENYKMIINKIPLVEKGNSGEVDDFAISLELSKFFTDLMNQALPDLVASVYSPFDVDVVDFEKSNSGSDTDILGKSINNLFSNVGVSQMIVSGGNNSTYGLKLSMFNDLSNVWVWVNRFESWLRFFIRENISDTCYFEILRVTQYNLEEYLEQAKTGATLGGSAMSLLAALEGDPYVAVQKLRFEDAIGLKDMMVPLSSTFTTSGTKGEVGQGRDPVDDSEISDSGQRSRDS